MKQVSCLLAVCVGIALVVALAAEPSQPGLVFTDITQRAGLLDPLAGLMGHGGAVGDFDGDGKLDLFAGGFCDRPDREYAPAGKPVAARLLRNRGEGRFEAVADSAVSVHGRTSGAVFADLDNDGDLDLYVANNSRRGAKGKPADTIQGQATRQLSQLFRNDAGKFVDISTDCGACPPTLLSARNIGVFDYDRDGLLDLLVIEDRFTPKPRTTLFRNKGGLKFEDANSAAGLPDGVFGLGVAVADLNGDGQPDFFVPHSNRLFISQEGNGEYREATELAKVFAHEVKSREDWPCGAAFGDLNRDGRLDLVISAHHVQARNRVFLNEGVKNGVPVFREVTDDVGLGDRVPARCPHVEIQDFDNDGWPDIYTSAAWLDGKQVIPLVYHNQGVKDGLPRFVPPRPIEGPMVYYPAGPSGDFDGDGRLDLFLINWFAGNHSRLLHNDSPPRRWLDVRVVGKKMNRMGIGAGVRVYQAGMAGKSAGLVGYQEVTTGYGYASGQPAVCHFGLGDVGSVDVQVTLPDRRVVTRAGVKADQVLTIPEP